MRTGLSSRYLELDGLRGIAAGSVVLYHLFHLYDVYFDPAGDRPVVEFSLGFYGVHLFFLISGYVILLTAQRGDAVDFAVSRVSRLYPTYWACLTLSWVVVLVAGVGGLFRSPLEIAVNYSMVQRLVGVRSVDGAYWSLSVEIVFYALVFVLLAWLGTLTAGTVRRVVVGWLALSVLVAAASRALPGSRLLDLVQVVTVTEYAALFSTGMLLLLSRRSGRVEPLTALSVVVGFAVTWSLQGLSAALVVTALSLAFAAVVLVPGVPVLRWRPLVLLGEISFPLYLVHQNVGYVVLERLVGHVDRTLASVLAVLVVLVLAWGVHHVVEVPASRWVRRSLRAVLRRDAAPA
ncbi:acyltransferase [Marmoricola endophyticus]|uniref:Acyltransferase n=1 Tax=Marmoricola endophyticus TaxID=2040280 RepID=A0A917F4I3_9ACTN|nr:acyltransferase [Marmoricola endophyticus]GGF51851.1 acyltransferase [Marmoricola endophyticus]